MAPKEVRARLFTARSPSCTDRFPATRARETMSTSDYSLLYESAHRLRQKLSEKRPPVCLVLNLDWAVFFERHDSKYWSRFATGLGLPRCNLFTPAVPRGALSSVLESTRIERRYTRQLRPCCIHAHFGPRSCSKQGSMRLPFLEHRTAHVTAVLVVKLIADE